jgi:hypothetical protein
VPSSTLLHYQRLWGANIRGGESGFPVTDAAECANACAATAGSVGWNYWKNGVRCWCVKTPWRSPAVTGDPQWESGVFLGNPLPPGACINPCTPPQVCANGACRDPDPCALAGVALVPAKSNECCPEGNCARPTCCFQNQAPDAIGVPALARGLPPDATLGISQRVLAAIRAQRKPPGQVLGPPFDPCPDDPTCHDGIRPLCCRTNIGLAQGAVQKDEIEARCALPDQLCFPCGEGLHPVPSDGRVVVNGVEHTPYICATTGPKPVLLVNRMRNLENVGFSALYWLVVPQSESLSKYCVEDTQRDALGMMDEQQLIGALGVGPSCGYGVPGQQVTTEQTVMLQPGQSMCVSAALYCTCGPAWFDHDMWQPPICFTYDDLPPAGGTVAFEGVQECDRASGECKSGGQYLRLYSNATQAVLKSNVSVVQHYGPLLQAERTKVRAVTINRLQSQQTPQPQPQQTTWSQSQQVPQWPQPQPQPQQTTWSQSQQVPQWPQSQSQQVPQWPQSQSQPQWPQQVPWPQPQQS